MTMRDKFMEMLDRTSTEVAVNGILRNECKKNGKYTPAARQVLSSNLSELRESIVGEYWDYLIEFAHVRWEDLDFD